MKITMSFQQRHSSDLDNPMALAQTPINYVYLNRRIDWDYFTSALATCDVKWTKSISFSSTITMGHLSSPSLNEIFKGFQFIHTNGCASYYLPSAERMDNSQQHRKVQLSRTTQGSPTFAQPITIHL